MKAPQRILVARTDRLGDVLLSLPALSVLRRALPTTSIDFLCPPQILQAIAPFLAEMGIEPVAFTSPRLASGRRAFRRGYGATLFLHAPAAWYWAARLARVPIRMGNRSRVPSLLTLNRGLRQNRSGATRSEGEYALELVGALLACLSPGTPAPTAKPIRIPVDPADSARALAALSTAGLEAGERFAILHPGMGGSALNLSAEKYLSLLDAWQGIHLPRLVLSEGPSTTDQEMARRILELRPDLPHLSGLPLPVFREILRLATVFLGPSTGTLHLAHFVGTPTVGLFSPVKSHCPERWAPRGGVGFSEVLLPAVDCPGKRGCIGPRCKEYFCMDRTPWEEMLLKTRAAGQR